MKKKNVFLLVPFLLTLLNGCGGYEKTNTLTCYTLNHDHKFSIDVKVYQANLSSTSFYFQNGYSMTNLKQELSDSNVYYQEYETDLFINTIISNRSEYFLITSGTSMDGNQLYSMDSISTLYYEKNGLRQDDYFLMPYFLLRDKNDYHDIDDFCQNKDAKEITLKVTSGYEQAKLLYSQTAQKQITYDDSNKKITVYDSLSMTFTESDMVLARK